jgi:hypothetical protein
MQAFAWNCMNQALDAKGEAVTVKAVRQELPMPRTGADRSVGAMKPKLRLPYRELQALAVL